MPKMPAGFRRCDADGGDLEPGRDQRCDIAEGNAGFIDAVELRPRFALLEGEAEEPGRVQNTARRAIGSRRRRCIAETPFLRAAAMMWATKPCSPAPWTVGASRTIVERTPRPTKSRAAASENDRFGIVRV